MFKCKVRGIYQEHIINPASIKEEDCPVFVNTIDVRGIVGFGIREKTHGLMNHSMLINRPGYFVSQGLFFEEIPFDKYLKNGLILKYWKCKDITIKEKALIQSTVLKDLALPRWRRFYDFFGIIGQAVGLRWINVPWLNYCSEKVCLYVDILIPSTKVRRTPQEIEDIFKYSPRMEVVGYTITF